MPLTLAGALALPFVLSWFYGSYVALATGHYEGYAIPSALQAVLAVCLVIGLSEVDGVTGAVLGLTAAHVIVAIVRLPVSRRIVDRQRGRATATAGQLRRAIGFGVKGYGSNALQAINYRLDLFILNATATGAVVGHYALAVSVTSVLWVLPQAVSDVLYPRVAALSGQGGEQIERLRVAEAKSLRHSALVSIVVASLAALSLAVLVVPIYGGAFRQSIVLGLILLPGRRVSGSAPRLLPRSPVAGAPVCCS